MRERRGEKVGWLVGWTGGFVWLAILAVVGLVQGKLMLAVVCIGLVIAGVSMIFGLAPWRHPETRYWKLMLPLYVLLITAVAVIVWFEGGPARLGLSGRSLLACLPLFLPFVTAGGRTWMMDGRSSDT
jgi:hypothetical protein